MKRLAVLAAAALLCACSSSRSPQPEISQPGPPPHADFPPEFHDLWKPGYVETLNYEWVRRGVAGKATMRTGIEGNLLRMDLQKRADGVAATVSVWMTLQPDQGRPAGAIRQVSIAWQAPGVNDYTQVDLANTSALVYRLGSPAWQRQYVVPYPAPGFPAEAFLLWARRFAWPRVRIGATEVITALLPVDRERRTEARIAALTLRSDGTAVMQYDGLQGYTTARMYRDFPHRIREWKTPEGESGKLIE